MKPRLLLFVLVVCLWACSSNPERDPVVGEAFVGPSTLQVRKELSAKAELVATLKHGDRVGILGRRRRFYKIRTSSDLEGWVDGRQLLSTANMAEIRKLAERAAKAPSQGHATVYETLNVHSVPNRQSPSFFQIAPEEKVELVALERTPRVAFDPPDLIPVDPLFESARKPQRKKADPSLPPPPAPKPPSLPDNWLELSRAPVSATPTPAQPPHPAAAPMDDWALVRSKEGRAGWVLGRMLLMSVPDEVAQYAERARITSYFQIGSTNDHGEAKPAWLWSTLSQGGVPYQFDSMRIFSWNPRKRHYETAFIERGMKGYLPVTIKSTGAGQASGFSVVVQEKDGRIVERDYVLNGFRAKVASRKPGEIPQLWYQPPGPASSQTQTPADPNEGDWADKAKGLLENITGRLRK
jgi:hypothetical protein